MDELLRQRDALKERICEANKRIFRGAEHEERRAAQRERTIYQAMLEDVETQIRAIDRSEIEPKRESRARVSVMSMDRPNSNGKGTFGDTLAARSAEDAAEPPLDGRRLNAVLYAAAQLTPRQAEALQLRFNEGYSLKKVAEAMGVSRRTAQSLVSRGQKVLSDWAALTEAVRQCAFSESVFDFEEFLELFPNAFPTGCREAVLTLYNAPVSAFPTVAALSRAMERNPVVLARQMEKARALCELYGIPLGACHPLIRGRKARACDGGSVLHRFDAYGHKRVCRCRHDDEARNFEARRDEFRHRTVEEAVFARLRTQYGLTEIDGQTRGFVTEGLSLFDEDRLTAARERLDEGKRISACRDHAVRKTRGVIETAALYAYFRSDVARIFAGRDAWSVLFERWDCFPGRLGDVLRELLDSPEIRSPAHLGARLGVAGVNAAKSLKKLAWYAQWWGIPAKELPEPVRRYLGSDAAVSRRSATFLRAVKPLGNHKTCKEEKQC